MFINHIKSSFTIINSPSSSCQSLVVSRNKNMLVIVILCYFQFKEHGYIYIVSERLFIVSVYIYIYWFGYVKKKHYRISFYPSSRIAVRPEALLSHFQDDTGSLWVAGGRDLPGIRGHGEAPDRKTMGKTGDLTKNNTKFMGLIWI